ncbi:hypothetical protein CTEN210_02640 [Chaetoceros tenuissimus]|uniref:Uncharacterized protein n=1 Tax=Chaetoceros tenuissimus TaxID=426638 RepID=A0AAD3CHX4_9STRA|nr:hypothetical protein CTEN210_02640 [Chaetoceros tenuissimus]
MCDDGGSIIIRLLTENTVDWDNIIHIYKTKKYNSKSTQAVDWRKRTPLHLACIKSAPLEAIKAIIKLCKDLLLQQDYDGLLPIHHLCTETSPVQNFRFVLNKCPEEVLLHQDRKGYTPLHHCCISGKDVVYFEELIEMSGQESILIKDYQRRNVMHLAIIHGLGIQHLQLLADTCPRSLNMEDARGYFPLHYACCYPSISPHLLQFLVQRNQRVCRIKTNNGSNCLQLLYTAYREDLESDERFQDDFELATVNERQAFSEEILECWQKVVILIAGNSLKSMPCDSFTAPVHPTSSILLDMIQLDLCPYIFVRLALLLNTEIVREQDKHGNLPLHFAIGKPVSRRCEANYSKIIDLLVDTYPDACRIKNYADKYPLHLAIEREKKWNLGIKKVLEVFPTAIHSLDLDVRLFPFLLAKLDKHNMFKILSTSNSLMPK